MNMASVNERDLLAAATQGSQVAYRELIHLHQAAVYRFACMLKPSLKTPLSPPGGSWNFFRP